MSSEQNPAPGELRLDIWLWAARFFKTRSLAKQAIDHGRVEVDGDRAKPARLVRIGQQLRIRRGDDVFVVEVTAIHPRRGNADAAAVLYQETQSSLAERTEQAQRRARDRASFSPPPAKPDKKSRRSLRSLLDYHGPG